MSLKASLNKSAYTHGENVNVTIDVKNDSRKVVRKIRVSDINKKKRASVDLILLKLLIFSCVNIFHRFLPYSMLMCVCLAMVNLRILSLK